jgi:hypothetical protein
MRLFFACAILALLLVQPAVAGPHILKFTVVANDILYGESALLDVVTSGAYRVYLEPGNHVVSAGDYTGRVRVWPTETTTYDLIVVDSAFNELERASVEVRVNGPFRVDYFTATEVLVGRSESTTLSWHITGPFDSAELVGVTPPSSNSYGMVTVTPGASRSYELRVVFGEYVNSSILQIEVSQEFAESRFFLSYSPDEIQPVAPGLGVFTPFTVHVLALSLEGTGIRGFEFGLDLPEGAEILGIEYGTSSVLNIVTPPEFIVGYGFCVPTSNLLYRVASLEIIATDDEVIDSGFITLRPAVVQSIPERLAYVTCRNGLEGSEYSSTSEARAGPPLYFSPQDNEVPTLQLGFRAQVDAGSVRLEWSDLPYPLIDRIEIGRSEAGMQAQPLVSFRGAALLELLSYEDNSAPRGVELSYVLRAYQGQQLLTEEVAKMSSAAWEAPQRTRITGSYPNPFNPETNIRFDATEAGVFEIRIVDTAGRRVRRLEKEVSAPGIGYEVRWDGRDSRGTPAASGVYFVELRGPNVIDRHRIALIK